MKTASLYDIRQYVAWVDACGVKDGVVVDLEDIPAMRFPQ